MENILVAVDFSESTDRVMSHTTYQNILVLTCYNKISQVSCCA